MSYFCLWSERSLVVFTTTPKSLKDLRTKECIEDRFSVSVMFAAISAFLAAYFLVGVREIHDKVLFVKNWPLRHGNHITGHLENWFFADSRCIDSSRVALPRETCRFPRNIYFYGELEPNTSEKKWAAVEERRRYTAQKICLKRSKHWWVVNHLTVILSRLSLG